MSRNTSASSRPVISQPKPYDPSALPDGTGPYPSFQRPNPNGADNRPASPMRPVRSLRRAPSDSKNAAGVGSSSGYRPSERSRLAPVQQSRRGSAEENKSIRPHSPVSPVSPSVPMAPGSSEVFSDPWAADRNQRSELLAQSSASALRPTRGAEGVQSDRLRNVVGAFMSASKSKSSDEPKRPGKSEGRALAAKQARDRDQQDLTVGGDGGQFAEIDGVLRKIKKDWPFVMDSDFSPSTLALSLLASTPSSSLPEHPSLSSFLKLHSALSTSLQSAVQAHFQSFAASLPAHAQFLATLGRAQQQVRASKDSLKEARDGFAGKGKAELASIRARERMVRDMLRILDVIDHLKQIPDQLESLIADKRFLQAAILLVRSLKTINKPEMLDIGAVADLRTYLAAQESALVDILVEELHQHLYLKTFYSDNRWSAYTPGQQSLSQSDDGTDQQLPRQSSTPPITTQGPSSSRLSRYLTSLSLKPNHDPLLDVADSELDHALPKLGHSRNGASIASIAAVSSAAVASSATNPEVDSFSYMESLLEASAVLGKLGLVVDIASQRVGSELYTLIETTLEEVEERAEQRRLDHTVGSTDLSPLAGPNGIVESAFTPSQSLRMAVALEAGPPLHALILRDLFWTLYSKLAAVLEGHRVLYEVVRWIASRRDFKDPSLTAVATLSTPVLEIWKPMRREVRSLLHDYLTDDDRIAFTRNPTMSINEVLKGGKIARDRQKQIFKFADTDAKGMMKDIKEHDEALNQTLLASVPGLVNSTNGDSQQALAPAISTSDDRYSSAGRHRRLIPASAFNITTLFQPTSALLARAIDIIPPGYENETAQFGGGLEDFVVKVFLPQLEEKVTASFQQAVGGMDAFQRELKSGKGSDRPPVQSATKVTALVQGLCSMLLTTPFHRENYSRLIVGVIVQYYQQCSTHFRDVASLPQPGGRNITKLALSASWAQRNDFSEILSKILAIVDSDQRQSRDLAQREVKLALNLLEGGSVTEKELIPSRRKTEQLGNLYHSLRWFIEQLLDLKSVAEEPLSPGADLAEPETASPLATIREDPDGPPKLPLTRAMAQRYDAIIQTYEQLANMVLFTIRLELRCRVICYVDAAMSKGSYRMECDAFEPDPHVIDLNTILVDCDEAATLTIPDKERTFLFQGLGLLTDTMLVTSARKIKSINSAGVQKIRRNILALQQSLRSVLADPSEADFERSKTYWDLYLLGAKDMMEGIRNSGPAFSFEEYNTMLNLQCKVDQSEAANSELNSHLIDLHSLSMSGEGWDEA